MNLIIDLQPIDHKRVMVGIHRGLDDYEPLSVVDIDTFYTPGDNEIWTLLNEGKEVVCDTTWKQYGEVTDATD